ncbi:MAG: Gfo/Idh/MocA family oxidoreductase [Anaerolineae bacterium]|nr:Gfo/Idh/MocA family oxidoreductase [Anaerolineae bacterium]
MSFAMGLIGCGVMGRRHVIGMKQLKAAGKLNFDLVAVCDIMPANLLKMADHAEELLGTRPQQFADFDSMLKATKLDGIIVTTSPEMHTEVAEKAFDAGIHVMVEKPITLTVSEGVRLVEAGKKANRKLAVAENYRRDPINRLGKALIESGAVGTPFLATQESNGGGEFVIITPWRHRKDRGGIVIDMGVHYTDILEFYLGPIDTVAGMNAIVDKQRTDHHGTKHEADAEDLSVGVMRFQNGAIANWLLNVAGRGEGSFSRMIYGTSGSLAIPGDRTGKPLRLVQRRDGKDVTVEQEDLLKLVPDFHLDDVTAALFKGDRLTTYDMTWADIDANLLGIEQSDFVDAAINNREPEVTGEQGLRSLALVFGLLESELLKRMVTLDEILEGKDSPYQAEIERGMKA